MTATRVRVVAGGPLLVSGPVEIELPGGDVVESDRFMVAICTCRRSDDYPLCDTSHRRCRNLKDLPETVKPGEPAATSAPAATTP